MAVISMNAAEVRTVFISNARADVATAQSIAERLRDFDHLSFIDDQLRAEGINRHLDDTSAFNGHTAPAPSRVVAVGLGRLELRTPLRSRRSRPRTLHGRGCPA